MAELLFTHHTLLSGSPHIYVSTSLHSNAQQSIRKFEHTPFFCTQYHSPSQTMVRWNATFGCYFGGGGNSYATPKLNSEITVTVSVTTMLAKQRISTFRNLVWFRHTTYTLEHCWQKKRYRKEDKNEEQHDDALLRS